MPRVLRIINRLNLGGPTWNAALLARHLEPEFETMLVSGNIDASEASSEFIVSSLHLQPVYVQGMYRELNPLRDLPALLRLQQIIRQFRPHIVHTHAAKAGALGRMAAWLCQVPVVVHTFHGHVFHSYFSESKSRMFVRMERFLAARSHAIVAISPLLKRELVEEYNICREDKVEVIPLGLDLDRFTRNQDTLRQRFRQQYRLSDDDLVVSIVGRLVPVKNHQLFFQALALVQQQIARPIRAFVVGDGELRQPLEDFAREQGLSLGLPEAFPHQTSVTFTSWVQDVERVYAGSDVVALTSLNEGTPVSIIEAQAAGKAVVATRTGGIADLIVHGVNGLLADRCDAESFARELLHVLSDASLRQALGREAAKEARQRHDYHSMVEQMGSLYRRLLQA